MRYRITKEFHFSASHVLNGLTKGHPCGRLHGHNYLIKIELAANNLNELGFVQDYGELKPIKDFIDSTFDHRHLNDILVVNPTAENIGKYLYHRFKSEFPLLSAVEVSETPKTNCRYEP